MGLEGGDDTEETMADTIVHFEIPADDPDALKAFYGDVFGWQFQTLSHPGMPGGEYIAISTRGEGGGYGIDGGMYKKAIPGDKPRNYISVTSLGDTVAKVKASGGTVIVERMAVPGVGYIAIVQDPEGNDTGVIQPDANAG